MSKFSQMSIEKSKHSDSDYNFSDETENPSSDEMPIEENNNAISTQQTNSLANYKNAAERWSINQIVDEIGTLSSELEKIKSDESKKEKNSPGKPGFYRPNRNKRKKGHCFCKGKYSLSAPMVQCDSCAVWYHQSCVGLTQNDCDKMESFVCEECKRERLEEMDWRRSVRLKNNGGDANSNINSFERMRKLLQDNRAFYYKNKKNFVRLFGDGTAQKKFCKKALKMKNSNLEKKLKEYETELKKLISLPKKENNEKSIIKIRKKLDFNRSKSLCSVKKEKRDKKKEIESDSNFVKDKTFKTKKLTKDEKEKISADLRQYKCIKSSSPQKIVQNKRMVRKVKRLMKMFKLSQKQISKEAKLTGGSTTLSSWLNGNYVFNIQEKEQQIKHWFNAYVNKLKKDTKGLKSKTKKSSRKFKVGEKVDFNVKKEWVSGEIVKISQGQYSIRYRKNNETKTKWVAALANRLRKVTSSKKGKSVRVLKK